MTLEARSQQKEIKNVISTLQTLLFQRNKAILLTNIEIEFFVDDLPNDWIDCGWQFKN